jgi:hypothetical protein
MSGLVAQAASMILAGRRLEESPPESRPHHHAPLRGHIIAEPQHIQAGPGVNPAW